MKIHINISPARDELILEQDGELINLSGYKTITLAMQLATSPRPTPVAQILGCTSPISHNAQFYSRNVHMCAH